MRAVVWRALRRPSLPQTVVAVQLAALLVVGAVAILRTSIWAEIDERPHFDYIQKVVEDGRLPRPTDLISREALAINDRTWPRPSRRDPATIGLTGRSYEAIQPPLYYVVAAPAFAIPSDHLVKAKAIRWFDFGLLLVAVLLLWRLARAIAPPGAALPAFAAGAMVVLWPGVVVRGVTIGNTPLELVVATAFLLVLWCADAEPADTGRRRRLLLAAAVLLGLALLTKLTLVMLVPLYLVVLLRGVLRERTRGRVLEAAALAALPALMLVPWLATNVERYRSSTVGIEGDPGIGAPGRAQTGALERLLELPERNARLFDGVLAQEFNAQLDVWWVRALCVALVLALLAGAVALVVIRRRDRLAWFFTLPALTGWALMNLAYVRSGDDAFLLRYLYPALLPLAVAAGAALASRSTAGARRVVVASAALTVVVGLLWIDVGGAFYFLDVGDRLGI